jgi:hypothetical protein
VLVASTAILERSRSFSRALLELERRSRHAETPVAREPSAHRPAARLLIVLALDGLRADHLPPPTVDAPGALASLAREGFHFQTVLAQASHPLVAHKSLLSGRSPGTLMLAETGADLVELSALRAPRDYMLTTFTHVEPVLAQRFRAGGYRAAAFTDGRWVGTQTGFAHGFGTLEESREGLAEALPRALAWLEGLHGHAAFLFVQTSELVRGGPTESTAPSEPSSLRTRYAARLSKLEHELQRFLDELRTRGLYESALIALCAGHGLALGENGRSRYGGLSLEELRVPLVLKLPQEHELSGATREPAALIDLAPTLLEAAGLPIPGGLDGRSLFPLLHGREPGRDCLVAESLFIEGPAGEVSPAARTFVRPGRWQVLHDPARASAGYQDLREDAPVPGLQALDSADVPALLEALFARAASRPRPRYRPEGARSAELERALADLGYARDTAAGQALPRALR